MIDTGRRFYPVPLVKSILDGMAAVKMNVLHFHLSEECFRVASTSYPALTASCRSGSMTNNEVYSQDDVTELVGYARSRGIRVVPEFDMPGHSGGFCTNLASAGIQCCGSQIEDDPEGKSAEIIQTVGSSTSLHPVLSHFLSSRRLPLFESFHSFDPRPVSFVGSSVSFVSHRCVPIFFRAPSSRPRLYGTPQ